MNTADVQFTDPMPYGYVYAGMTVDPPARLPRVRHSTRRDEALEEYTALARRLEALGQVVSATVYRAVVIPPIEGGPRFDVVLLVEATSPEAAAEVRASEPGAQLEAEASTVLTAHNLRRIGDTHATRTGTFLFNHFTAPDPEGAVAAWETLTGWYTTKAGVDNSTLLVPTTESPYAFVNYVRLPAGPARFLFAQFSRPSFYRVVRSTLKANGMVAAPVLCQPV